MALRDDCQSLVDRLNARVGADLTLRVADTLSGRKSWLLRERGAEAPRYITPEPGMTLRQMKAWLSAMHRALDASDVDRWRMQSDNWARWRANHD